MIRKKIIPLLIMLHLPKIMANEQENELDGNRTAYILQNILSTSFIKKNVNSIKATLLPFLKNNFPSPENVSGLRFVATRVISQSSICLANTEFSAGLAYGYSQTSGSWDHFPGIKCCIASSSINFDLRNNQIRPVCVYLSYDLIKRPNLLVRLEFQTKTSFKIIILGKVAAIKINNYSDFCFRLGTEIKFNIIEET